MNRYLPIALVLLATGPVQAAEKVLDKTFAVSPGGSLTVDADRGEVHVTGGDGSQVVVHMTSRDSESTLADTTLEAVQNGNAVTVTLRKPTPNWFFWGHWGGKESIEVSVPRQFAVSVRTGGGSVRLSDTVGAATLRTSGGDVAATNVRGNVELRTSGGSIHADNIHGNVDGNTSGGSVRLMQIDGTINGHTSGGGVHCSLVGANRGINATTAGGGIELILPRATAANVDASTSGGSVKTEFPVTTTIIKGRQIKGTINGGGPSIYARTSGGSVTLRAAD